MRSPSSRIHWYLQWFLVFFSRFKSEAMALRRGRAKSDLEVQESPKKAPKRTKEQIHNNEQTRKTKRTSVPVSWVDAADLVFERSRMRFEDLLTERWIVEQKFEKLKVAYEEATGRDPKALFG